MPLEEENLPKFFNAESRLLCVFICLELSITAAADQPKE
jgi:hypothetical protein